MPSIPRSLPFPLTAGGARVVSDWSATATARSFGVAGATGVLTLSGSATAATAETPGRLVSNWTAPVSARTAGVAVATGSLSLSAISSLGGVPEGAQGLLTLSGTAFIANTTGGFWVITAGVKREIEAAWVIINGERHSVTLSVISGGEKKNPSAPSTDTTPPAVPFTPSVVAGDKQVTLNTFSVFDAVTYRWYRNGVLVGSSAVPSYVDTGLTNGVTYTYRVSAGDANANFSVLSPTSADATPVAPVTPDTTAPTVPGAPVATAGDGQVSLITTGSTDTQSGVASYKWYRGVTLVGTTSGTGFTEVGLTNGTAYTYTVAAIDVAGNESAKSAASNTVTPAAAPDATPPEAPDAPIATAGDGFVSLATNPGVDNVGVTGYRWFRDGVLVGTTSSPSYTDTGVINGTTYTYKVGAGDAAGNWSPRSADSNPVAPGDTTAPATPSAPVATAGTNSVSLTVSPPFGTPTQYRWTRGGLVRGTTTTPSFTETGLPAGVAVTYTVSAGDAAGNWSGQSPSSNSVTPTSTVVVSQKVIIGMSAPVELWDERFAQVNGQGKLKARRIFCRFASGGQQNGTLIRRAIADGHIPVLSYKQDPTFNIGMVEDTGEFLASLNTEIIVAYHHEPLDNFGAAGQPTVAEYNRRTQQYLPILGQGSRVKTATFLNGWVLNNREEDFTKFLPPASLALMDYCGMDTYQGGTDANPTTFPGTRIPLLRSLLQEMGRPDMQIVIGEYNTWRADALADIQEKIYATKTIANQNLPFVYLACLWNDTGGVGKVLEGERLTIFRNALNDPRRF